MNDYNNFLLSCPTLEKTHQETTSSDPQEKTKTTSSDPQAKTKIEIQSGCQWKKDHKMVLEALCQRLKENRLTRRFYVGPYCVSPVARIFMRKPSGSTITYRVCLRVVHPHCIQFNSMKQLFFNVYKNVLFLFILCVCFRLHLFVLGTYQ